MATDIKHTILIMTYKQEEYIASCLDSVLLQSVMPYEVVVCDDCSPDRTWDIVQSYVERYPGIVKAHRNKVNLGVFGNYNQMVRRVTGDFVNIVAGDDMLPAGALEAYNKFIEENQLNCKEPFAIYTNSDVILPDNSLKHYNNYKYRMVDPIEFTLLCEFYHWDTGLSAELVRQMPDIESEIGYQADWLQHIQRYICCKNHYFINATGYIYRQGVGVTVAENGEKQRGSLLYVIDRFKRDYPFIITKKVAKFFAFIQHYFAYIKEPSAKNYFLFLFSRIYLGKMRKSSNYYHNWKILVPVGARRVAKKILRIK